MNRYNFRDIVPQRELLRVYSYRKDLLTDDIIFDEVHFHKMVDVLLRRVWVHLNGTSKYRVHQSAKEMARRIKQRERDNG